MVEWADNGFAGRRSRTSQASAWWVRGHSRTITEIADGYRVYDPFKDAPPGECYPTLEAAKVAYLMLMSITT